MQQDKRVQFDFEVEFLNGGGLQGQGFRLDIEGEHIADQALADYIVRDLRLLMVGRVQIRNKSIIAEAHRRDVQVPAAAVDAGSQLIDLSHTIEDGMITYKGLPAPLICDHLSRVQSRQLYTPGTEFQIGKITMVSNTGTYLDSPFHRYADGADLSALRLQSLAGLEGVLIRLTGMTGMAGNAVPREVFAVEDLRGKAVLVHTGWDRHWRTDRYFEGHPFLTAGAADFLKEAGAALVGIDSYNIDDITDGNRPVHTSLLGAGIPIVEHMRGLEQLPASGFRFSAVPPKILGMGTFPVRAFATLSGST